MVTENAGEPVVDEPVVDGGSERSRIRLDSSRKGVQHSPLSEYANGDLAFPLPLPFMTLVPMLGGPLLARLRASRMS